MNFVSREFIIFLSITWSIFALLPARFRTLFLTLASYLFYATWSIPFILVILFTTSVDYIASKVIYSSEAPEKRKSALTIAITINLLVLGFFKYFNLLLAANGSLLSLLRLPNPAPAHLDIILPLGISYYTFEAISYLVDVYRGSAPAKSWWNYNFYIMYFPHLISGPIIRFSELLPQYQLPLKLPPLDRIRRGAELVIFGYAFKVLIADTAALVADPIFSGSPSSPVLSTYVGVLAFTTQIYFDFLGYTHIARGVSLLFNIELPVNFNHPFSAGNLSNFWERWQMSLSRWIKDYLFIPLGGSRGGVPRTMFNLLLVMAIAGAWHGAGWTYIVWGLFHGLLLASYHAYRNVRLKVLGAHDAIVTSNFLYRVFSVALTFTCVAIACIIFRSPTIQAAGEILNHLTRLQVLAREIGETISGGYWTPYGNAVLLLLCCFSGPALVRRYQRLMETAPAFVQVQAATAIALLCWVMCGEGLKPFIYFQF